MVKRTLAGFIFFFCASMVFAQEKSKIVDFGHRVTLGVCHSYKTDNIGIIEPMYSFLINVPYIIPNYNLMDFGYGVSLLMAFGEEKNIRMPVFGFGLNASIRLFSPPVKRTRIFVEGIQSLVIYTIEYPENGTRVNGGWHFGGGIEHRLMDNTKIFASINWFHTSNNDIHGRERNPGIDAVGFGMGIQF